MIYREHLTYLDVSINQPVQLDIIIVLTERIDQHLGDFQPADVETKLRKYIGSIKEA